MAIVVTLVQGAIETVRTRLSMFVQTADTDGPSNNIKEESIMEETAKKYYKVTCKCGHVGKAHYVPISFALIANSKKEAAEKARSIPRVKHQHKDAILNVEEVDYEAYKCLVKDNNYDPYLKCSNKQEQSLIIDFETRIVHDPHYENQRENAFELKEKRRERIAYLLRKRAVSRKLDCYYSSCTYEQSACY